MRTQYSHIIVVPAQRTPKGLQLMEPLARQMFSLKAEKFRIVGIEDCRDPSIAETAKLLHESLLGFAVEATLELPPVQRMSAMEDVTDEHVKSILEFVLGLAPGSGDAKVLVIVTDPDCAAKMARVFIWDFLENHSIQPHINQFFKPGEAGIVDCKSASRDTLRPRDCGASAAKSMLETK